MKALKVIGAIVLGLVGLAVLLYFVGVGVNWRDQPPSAAALEMKRILDERAQPRMALEELQLARYRELLQRPAWREVVPLEFRAPLPPYGAILDGQRLLFVDLAARAKSAPLGEIASAMRDDLAFWREAQESADLLLTKMIAIAAIRQHFLFANLVLREMPGARAEAIDAWSVPFSARELSMRRTMAGELAYSESVMRTWQIADEWQFIEPDAGSLTLYARKSRRWSTSGPMRSEAASGMLTSTE